MFDYIEQHKKLFLIAAILIVAGLTGILIFLSLTDKPPANTENPITNNEPNYSFLKEDLSQEEKYLMLLGKILTEEYGSYSESDISGLQDVQNQSTEQFKLQVQKIIDAVSAGKYITTVVDAETIELVKNYESYQVTMNAITTDQSGAETKIISTVTLEKQGEYWLTSGIKFENTK